MKTQTQTKRTLWKAAGYEIGERVTQEAVPWCVNHDEPLIPYSFLCAEPYASDCAPLSCRTEDPPRHWVDV